MAHTKFPLGDFTKTQIRKIAEKQGFFNADKRDSQDICFVPDIDYASTIERMTGKTYPCGSFIDQKGTVLGPKEALYSQNVNASQFHFIS